MVAVLGVDGEGADDFAGCGVDDVCVVAVDEQDDAGSVVGMSEADVVELAIDAQGDAAGVDADFDRCAGGDERAGVGMAQIVEANAGDVGAIELSVEELADRLGVHRVP